MKHDKAEDRVQLCNVARQDGMWRVADQPSSAGVLTLTDESDFMRYVLNEGLPLSIAGVLFHPVCCEFPSSPGVDMIWASDNGQFALGELKPAFRGYAVPCDELAHHYLDIEDTAITQLYGFAARKSCDLAPGALARLKQLVCRASALKASTFGDLRAEGRLHLVIMFASAPEGFPAAPGPFLAVHMVPRKDGSADVRLRVPAGTGMADVRPDLVRMAGRHRDGLARNRASGSRVARTSDNVMALYLNRPAGDPARLIVEGGREMGLRVRPGTGAGSVGLSLAVQSRSGIHRPLLCFTKPDTLFLQTNLIAYYAEFDRPREVIATALEKAAAAFSPDKCTLVGSNRRPRFDLRRFSPADTATLLRMIADLLKQLGR